MVFQEQVCSLLGGTGASLQLLMSEISPLCPVILRESCRSSGAASTAVETCSYSPMVPNASHWGSLSC